MCVFHSANIHRADLKTLFFIHKTPESTTNAADSAVALFRFTSNKRFKPGLVSPCSNFKFARCSDAIIGADAPSNSPLHRSKSTKHARELVARSAHV